MSTLQAVMDIFLSRPSLTLALLLGAISYITIQAISRIFSRNSKRRDVEAPNTPPVKSASEKNLPTPTAEHVLTPELKHSPFEARQLKHYTQLYHKIQNLEDHPSILSQARSELIALLSSTISEAQQTPLNNIFSVSEFSRSGLETFLKNENDSSTAQFEAYIARRRAGGAREMFTDKEEGIWWLKQAAPVKYVDGSWLGHINKISTPFPYRGITKNAWQVMSEELGDGELSKNHVYVYEALMREINANLPAGDDIDFIHPRHELDEVRVWRAAVAQLLVSLFAHDFLPESLGFNMAYEGLPLHLMKTVEELRELKLNGYYFVLHISIDNADSGHAKMATEAVISYIDEIRARYGDEEAHKAWRRVQAGYILAEGLPTTPECPKLKRSAEEVFPRNEHERRVIEIFASKAPVAHKVHCSSKLRIGRHTLVDWLEPSEFSSKKRQMQFLDDLAACRPWVKKGDSEGSKLVQELSWEGRMFGSFTNNEMEVLKAWIDALPDERPHVYCDFVGKTEEEALQFRDQDILVDYPVIDTSMTPKLDELLLSPPSVAINNPPTSKPTNPNESHHAHFGTAIDVSRLVPLWFASISLLESFVNVPAKVSNTLGSAVVRLLRAQAGFGAEGDGVAGMDEFEREVVGLVDVGCVLRRACGLGGDGGPLDLTEIWEAFGDEVKEERDFAKLMMHASMRPVRYRDGLLGMTNAFIELHERLAQDGRVFGRKMEVQLAKIAERERFAMGICIEEINMDEKRRRDFERGEEIARRKIEACFD